VESRTNENTMKRAFINVNKDCHMGLVKDGGCDRVVSWAGRFGSVWVRA